MDNLTARQQRLIRAKARWTRRPVKQDTRGKVRQHRLRRIKLHRIDLLLEREGLIDPPNSWHPDAIRDPGLNANYRLGRTINNGFDVMHFTVGTNSRALIRDRGLAHFLYPHTGPPIEFAPDDAVCLATHHRILTDDLRWVEAGTIRVGDTLMGFDEAPVGSARRWRRSVVVRSETEKAAVVRVRLASGEEILTTPEHPWLVSAQTDGTGPRRWAASTALMSSGQSTARGGRPRSINWNVQRVVQPWDVRETFDAGWLSGMFDGEGCLHAGRRIAPRASIVQVVGPVLSRVEALLRGYGFDLTLNVRGEPGRKKRGEIHVRGGLGETMRLLGEVRPGRLLARWLERAEWGGREVVGSPVAVVSVEPAGEAEVQRITTDTSTYVGEGYLMHNCAHACEANIYGDGHEREALADDNPAPTADQKHWIGTIVRWRMARKGLLAIHRPRSAGRLPVSEYPNFHGFADHGALQHRKCDQHTDGIQHEVMLAIFQGVDDMPLNEPDKLWIISTVNDIVNGNPVEKKGDGIKSLWDRIKSLPSGTSGGGITADQVRKIVRDEIDRTHLST